MIAEVPVDDCLGIRISEVNSFMQHHGLTLEDACELAGLDPSQHVPKSNPCYIPLPAEIARDCEAIRSGELVIVGYNHEAPRLPR